MKSVFIKKLLAACQNGTVAIMGHRSADFDCIGSCIAMHIILKKLNIPSDIFVENNLDEKFLKLTKDTPLYNQTDKKYDVCITVDCSTLAQIPDNLVSIFNSASKTFVIDHHISNTLYGQNNYVIAASSACEVIFGLFGSRVAVDRELASALYLGIYTDTGGFKYSNTTSHTFLVLSKLMMAEFEPDKLVHDCLDMIDKSSFELTKCAFNSVKFYNNDTIVVSLLTKQDLDANNVIRDTSKFMPGYLPNIKGVKIAIIITERNKGEYNISLRTPSDDVDVNKIASRFGGGGHTRASGLTLKGEYTKALNALLLECKKALKGD